MTPSSFMLTDFHGHENLLEEITRLENKMKTALGEQVALIAYSPRDAASPANPDTTTGCRPGLDD